MLEQSSCYLWLDLINIFILKHTLWNLTFIFIYTCLKAMNKTTLKQIKNIMLLNAW